MKVLVAAAVLIGISGLTAAHAEWEILDAGTAAAPATAAPSAAFVGGVVVAATAGGTGSCPYRSPSVLGENADFSQLVLLPANPYWVVYVPANAPELGASADNPCAGQPGHILFSVDPFAAPLPVMTADW